MAPHSGASLPNVALPSGDVLMHAMFIVGNEEVNNILYAHIVNIT